MPDGSQEGQLCLVVAGNPTLRLASTALPAHWQGAGLQVEHVGLQQLLLWGADIEDIRLSTVAQPLGIENPHSQ